MVEGLIVGDGAEVGFGVGEFFLEDAVRVAEAFEFGGGFGIRVGCCGGGSVPIGG